MLVKQTPQDVALKWNQIKYAVEASSPFPLSKDDLNLILANLLGRIMICWFIVDHDDIVGIVVTAIGNEDLLIHSLYVSTKINQKAWLDSINTLEIYARDKGCKMMTGYTNNNGILNMARRIDGMIESHYIVIPLS